MENGEIHFYTIKTKIFPILLSQKMHFGDIFSTEKCAINCIYQVQIICFSNPVVRRILQHKKHKKV